MRNAQELAANAELIANFQAHCHAKGISLTPSDFEFVPTIGIVAKSPGLLSRLLVDLPRERDQLLPLKFLKKLMPRKSNQSGYLSNDVFMVMAHPHFRRGMSEVHTFEPRFIDLFWDDESPDIDSFVALDENRVGLNVDGPYYFERDTWYGAAFSNEIAAVPLGVSKLKPPQDLNRLLISFLFSNAYALDIKWSQEANIKTFQALEIKTEEQQVKIDGEMFFPARYLHAEFSIETNVFRHFDGAIQYFTKSEYFERRDSDFNYNAKNLTQIKARSKKLFKLNGRIEVMTFVELSCQYFGGNPLTHEYFSGQYPQHLKDNLSRLKDEFPSDFK